MRVVSLLLVVLVASSSLVASAERSEDDISHDAFLRRLWRESMDNRYEGPAVPVGGDNFRRMEIQDLDASGDGVLSKACMEYWMVQAMTVNIYAGNAAPTNYCPFGPYGAVIVDVTDKSATNVKDAAGNNCGRLMETNSGVREVNIHNPMMHSEINAIVRLTNCTLHPDLCDATGKFLNAQNKTWWARFYLFTTAASCPADAASETLSGIKTIVQGVTVRDLLQNGWTQSSFIEPDVIYASARQNSNVLTLIKDVKRTEMLRYFNWQFTNVAYGCPDNCVVSTNPTTGARSCVNA